MIQNFINHFKNNGYFNPEISDIEKYIYMSNLMFQVNQKWLTHTVFFNMDVIDNEMLMKDSDKEVDANIQDLVKDVNYIMEIYRHFNLKNPIFFYGEVESFDDPSTNTHYGFFRDKKYAYEGTTRREGPNEEIIFELELTQNHVPLITKVVGIF